MVDKGLNQVVGVVPIANQVLPPEQHLKGGFGYISFKGSESLPGVFIQEPGSYIKGCTTPHLKGVKANGIHLLSNG